jgi:hypothetical protein
MAKIKKAGKQFSAVHGNFLDQCDDYSTDGAALGKPLSATFRQAGCADPTTAGEAGDD